MAVKKRAVSRHLTKKPADGGKIKNEDRYKRTISIELHEQWRALIRTGDPQKLADMLGVSKPLIDRALIYGSVHKQRLVDGITNYFASRLLKEKQDAENLQSIVAEITKRAEKQKLKSKTKKYTRD